MGAPVFFVKKKDGSLRLVCDWRQLNKITVNNEACLPNMDDLFDTVHGCKYFSKLDLHSGYNQVRIREEYIPNSGRLIPVQPHLHTLGMPGSFLIAWLELISFDPCFSTRSQSRLAFWSRSELVWSRSHHFAIAATPVLLAQERSRSTRSDMRRLAAGMHAAAKCSFSFDFSRFCSSDMITFLPVCLLSRGSEARSSQSGTERCTVGHHSNLHDWRFELHFPQPS